MAKMLNLVVTKKTTIDEMVWIFKLGRHSNFNVSQIILRRNNNSINPMTKASLNPRLSADNEMTP